MSPHPRSILSLRELGPQCPEGGSGLAEWYDLNAARREKRREKINEGEIRMSSLKVSPAVIT
jgi:hypothetical protein